MLNNVQGWNNVTMQRYIDRKFSVHLKDHSLLSNILRRNSSCALHSHNTRMLIHLCLINAKNLRPRETVYCTYCSTRVWFFRSDKYWARATKLWVSMKKCPLFCRILMTFGMRRQTSEDCPISNFLNTLWAFLEFLLGERQSIFGLCAADAPKIIVVK